MDNNIIQKFLEHFEYLGHSNLTDRSRRQSLVRYLHNLIQHFIADTECDSEPIVRDTVKEILDYHATSREQNGNICLKGKHHDILYIAVKICYDWNLEDTTTVTNLLNQIYLCERTFERIFAGALFGCTAPHHITGWKSDFADQEENVKAVLYFLKCANNAHLEYAYGKDNKMLRFIDIPLCASMPCVLISAMMDDPVQVLMWLRFGALINSIPDEETIFEVVLRKLASTSNAIATNELDLIHLIKILLRCSDKILLNCDESDNLPDIVSERYFDLLEKQILPINRCGFTPAELKHFSRLTIRKRLWENYQLPNGIEKLPLPDTLKRYVDIMED